MALAYERPSETQPLAIAQAEMIMLALQGQIADRRQNAHRQTMRIIDGLILECENHHLRDQPLPENTLSVISRY